jgi:hypothetical protein
LTQAAAGAAITPAGTGATSINFAVDRTRIAYSQNSKLTAQQNRGSVSPPTGFKNYLGVSCAATATVGATDYFLVGQAIEGYNVSDLSWGTAAASTVTLSFWARSNTIGTFGGSVNNSAYNRAYAFSYTINVADTWEYKTVTITGDTTGTWLTDNGVGAYVWFSLGSGSTVSKAAGSWGAGEHYGVTGANNLMGSTSNYLYITGVQFEKGTTASTFEFRSYQKELMLCQRYYAKISGGGFSNFAAFAVGFCSNSTTIEGLINYPVTMRAAATLSFSNVRTNTATGTNTAVTSVSNSYAGTNSMNAVFVSSGSSITQGQAGSIIGNSNSSAYVDLSAEL